MGKGCKEATENVKLMYFCTNCGFVCPEERNSERWINVKCGCDNPNMEMACPLLDEVESDVHSSIVPVNPVSVEDYVVLIKKILSFGILTRTESWEAELWNDWRDSLRDQELLAAVAVGQYHKMVRLYALGELDSEKANEVFKNVAEDLEGPTGSGLFYGTGWLAGVASDDKEELWVRRAAVAHITDELELEALLEDPVNEKIKDCIEEQKARLVFY